MFAKGVPLDELRRIADDMGVALVRVEEEEDEEISFALDQSPAGPEWWIRFYGQPQVCRHAYQTFVRRVLEQHPDAVLELQVGGPIRSFDLEMPLALSEAAYRHEFAGRFTECLHP